MRNNEKETGSVEMVAAPVFGLSRFGIQLFAPTSTSSRNTYHFPPRSRDREA